MRSSRFAPITSPRRPYSLVPQHHGISCVPKSEYAPGPSASAATQLKPPYAQIEPMNTFFDMSRCGRICLSTVGLWWIGSPAMKMRSACGMHSAGSDVTRAIDLLISSCGYLRRA